MKSACIPTVLALLAITVAALAVAARLTADDDHQFGSFHFAPDSLVVTRSVYSGTAATVVIGETLPPGCTGGPNGSTTVDAELTAGGTTPVTVPCGIASDNGEFPSLRDSHNVWNNANSDGSFGVTSPIFLDNISADGRLLDTLPIPTNIIVTSFSSKSELALNRSVDGKSLTFMGYRGGPGCPAITYVNGIGTQGSTSGPISPTAPSLLDVSASNTPGVCDPTNPVISTFVSPTGTPVIPTAYYRAVAEVDGDGHIGITDGNAYSGDNGRAAIKGGNGLYYMVGNDNSGNLSKKQLPITVAGVELINGTGSETLVPGQAAPLPPNIQMIGRLLIGSDKPGKDTNFRGLTIFNNTVYISKGSGSNGINTVYQVGSTGVLPTGTAAELATVPVVPLPGFPNTTASASTDFPFGMFFANSNTVYVCDEGDGTYVPGQVINGQTNVADAQSLATSGLQKWVLQNGTWVRVYILQDGLDLGIPYGVANYPASLDPATGGCRNIAGRVNFDGTVTIWAITSTISTNGDTGADPDKLVKITDLVSATTLPTRGQGWGWDNSFEHFVTIRTARAGEVLRGVALAPLEDDHGRGRGGDTDNFSRDGFFEGWFGGR